MQWLLFWKSPLKRILCQYLPCASIKENFNANFLSDVKMIFFKVTWVKQNVENYSEVEAEAGAATSPEVDPHVAGGPFPFLGKNLTQC